jgi:Na+/phosphate symporter
LVFLLALFGSVRAGAGGFGFCFLLGRVPLGIGLVLLGLALANYVVATDDASADLFRLAFDAFDSAFDGFFWPALLIAHGSILSFVVVELSLDVANR